MNPNPSTPKGQPNPNEPWQEPFPPIRLGKSKAYREKQAALKWERLARGILWEKETLYEILEFNPFKEEKK